MLFIMEKLIQYLKMEQSELKSSLYVELVNKGMDVIFEREFLYAKGDVPVLLVAHLDTVFDTPPKSLFYNEKKDILHSYRGIGGDDRCGVYAIMELLKEFRPHVLFTEGEEIGGIGAIDAVMLLDKPDVKYIIEFDRHGNNDCVFYDCGNEEFMDYIESFGFQTEQGTFTDISILGREWDVAAVNISSGYYNEHTFREYIRFLELKNNIKRVAGIIRELDKVPYFKYCDVYSDDYFDDLFEGMTVEKIKQYLRDNFDIVNNEDEDVMSLKKVKGESLTEGKFWYDD